jgi:hypothetical protein
MVESSWMVLHRPFELAPLIRWDQLALLAAQLGEILDHSGAFQKGKGPTVDQQALVN